MLTPFASPLNEGKTKRGGREIALKRNTQISSVGLTQFFSQAHVDWIYSSHGLDQILPSKLDLDCPFRLQHTTSGNRKDLSEERQGIKKKIKICLLFSKAHRLSLSAYISMCRGLMVGSITTQEPPLSSACGGI